MEHQGLAPETRMDDGPAVAAAEEEVLVADPRADLTPAQVVERKLVALLHTAPLSLSQIQSRRSGSHQ